MEKRIAMISYHTCPLSAKEGKETGGMNVYVFELARELSKNGYIVDVFTRSQDDKQPKIVTLSPTFRIIHLIAGPQKVIARKKLHAYIEEFANNFITFTSGEQNEYNIYHCHYYLSGLAAISIQKLSGKKVPLITTFHTLSLMKNLVARSDLEREEKQRIDAEFLLVLKSQKIVATSESDLEYLLYLYNAPKEKVVKIYPGVDTNLFKVIPKSSAKAFIGANTPHKIILFVGRIEPLKGIDTILYAIKILLAQDKNLNVCLWIVGGDLSQKRNLWTKELKKLEQLKKTLQITTVVTFVGQRPQMELPYYYNASEVVVIPSHYESFGMAALEAMACGVPVITTNVAGIASLFDKKHQKLITTVNNPLLLASQIEFILTSKAQRKKLGKELIERVKDMSWQSVAKKIEGVYRKVYKA